MKSMIRCSTSTILFVKLKMNALVMSRAMNTIPRYLYVPELISERRLSVFRATPMSPTQVLPSEAMIGL